MIQIGVIGAGKAKKREYTVGEQVGAEIGRRGHILVCGGLGGVMEAASKGARNQGGLSVGILPGATKEEANQYIDVRIVTAMSHARNAIIARTADVIIAVGGGAGTLSEIALSLKIGKPVIFLRDALPEIAVEAEGIFFAESAEKSLDLAEELCSKKQGGCA